MVNKNKNLLNLLLAQLMEDRPVLILTKQHACLELSVHYNLELPFLQMHKHLNGNI